MNHNSNNQVSRDQIKEYFSENIMKNIKLKTKWRLHQCIEQIPCPKEYIELFYELMSNYTSIEHRFIDCQDNDRYLLLEYLVQYRENEKTIQKMFDGLFDKICEIRDSLMDKVGENILSNNSVRANTLYEIDFDIFHSAIKFEKKIAHFIVHRVTLPKVDEIALSILGKKVSYTYVDLKNEQHNIDGVYYFNIENNCRTSKYRAFCSKNKIIDSEPEYSNEIIKRIIYSRVPAIIFNEVNREYIFQSTINQGLLFNSPNGRWREDLNSVFLSSWEANIARILNYKNINFKYEQQSFILKTHHSVSIHNKGTDFEQTVYYSYRPDFLLDDNTVLEIKGFWDDNSLEIVNCFENEHKDYTLFIIDCDMYYSLQNIYQNLIPNWEIDKTSKTRCNTVKVVGINRPDRISSVANLKINDNLFFQRESNNCFDKHAVKVLDKNNNMIGYLSKEWAYIYAKKLDIGMSFNVIVQSINPKVLSVVVSRLDTTHNIVYDFLSPTKI